MDGYEPTEKAPAIQDFLEQIAGRTTAIRSGKCIPPPIGCGRAVHGFRNERALREYRISGLCQDCQDEIFDRED